MQHFRGFFDLGFACAQNNRKLKQNDKSEFNLSFCIFTRRERPVCRSFPLSFRPSASEWRNPSLLVGAIINRPRADVVIRPLRPCHFDCRGRCPVAVPGILLGICLRRLPTAATRSGRFTRHGRRSHRSPSTARRRVAADDFAPPWSMIVPHLTRPVSLRKRKTPCHCEACIASRGNPYPFLPDLAPSRRGRVSRPTIYRALAPVLSRKNLKTSPKRGIIKKKR